ncbi:unnamed protein product, partial [Discosporangium mesarthrocarpum]
MLKEWGTGDSTPAKGEDYPLLGGGGGRKRVLEVEGVTLDGGSCGVEEKEEARGGGSAGSVGKRPRRSIVPETQLVDEPEEEAWCSGSSALAFPGQPRSVCTTASSAATRTDSCKDEDNEGAGWAGGGDTEPP